MDIKTNIENLLNDLKRMGKDRRTIETDLKYSTFYIDQLLSKKGNIRFYNALKRYHEMLMEDAWLEKSMPREAPYLTGSTGAEVTEAKEEYGDGKKFWSALPEYKSCDFATKAKGNSMSPLIQNNAIVGGKKLADASVIVYGEIYIIHTRNGIETIKYIQPAPGDPQSVLLAAHQENIPDTLLNRSDILRLFQARFVLNPL
jgi:hypothetical protein